jgi:hypothetical protein
LPWRSLVEHQIDLLGDQVLQHLGSAAIGHELEAGAEGVLKINGGEMRWAARARGSNRDVGRVRLEPGEIRSTEP